MQLEKTEHKLETLRELLRGLERVIVAYSAGVDSSFLAKVARDTLGRDNVLAVTGRSASIPQRELFEAQQFAQEHDIEHRLIDTDELDSPDYAANPSDRCYHCKMELFNKLWPIAVEERYKGVLDGTNADDMGDHRPGARAADERKVHSPLLEAGLTKQEIRDLSQEMGLSTWNKPEMACLASRIPYGDPITAKALSMVEQAEEFLRELGFSQFRVRHHGDIARLELLPVETGKAAESLMAAVIDKGIKEIGFKYVTLDLGGYQRGSLNRAPIGGVIRLD